MDLDNSENYQTTPNGTKGAIGRRKPFDRSILHPYRHSVELNSTALAPGSIIDKMPLYTPPKPSTLPVKNPFEQPWFLKEKLSQPLCSPSMFQKVISPINKSATFSWSIDEVSILRPAQIDENPSQEFTAWYSPDTETQAQAAIDRFFSSMSQGTLESPIVSRSTSKQTCTVACQTKLTFPPILPEAIEAELEALSQRLAGLDESMNTSNCSARRKILSSEDVDEPPTSDDESDAVSEQDQSMMPMFVATPVRPLACSSPECSPIKADCEEVHQDQDNSVMMTSVCEPTSQSLSR